MNQQTPNTAQDLSPAGTFALVFGVAFAILYVICDMAALPLFTYHPGTGRIDVSEYHGCARRGEHARTRLADA